MTARQSSFSRGKGGPSIGAPAGVGERLLAIPAGVDGLPDEPAPPGRSSSGTPWERVLDEMEARLIVWRKALRGEGDFPDWFEWPADLGGCPPRLRPRARLVLASQRDIEDEMTARRAAIAALLHGIGTTERKAPVPLFVDQRC